MSVLSRWRKGLSATNAGVALPAARRRTLSPKRIALGGVRTVFKLGVTMVIVVVVGAAAVTTAIATYVLLPLPGNLPDERIQPEKQASTVYALDGTPIGRFQGAESQVTIAATEIPDTNRRAGGAAADHPFSHHRALH